MSFMVNEIDFLSISTTVIDLSLPPPTIQYLLSFVTERETIFSNNILLKHKDFVIYASQYFQKDKLAS